MQAVLMAGGRGTRLYPYTAVLPKPLLPVGDKPVLELLLRHLRRHGIHSVMIAVNHLRHLIQNFFGDGSVLGMHIEYTVEDTPLGTCGPVGGVLDRMAPDFLLLNGDLLTDVDVSAFLAHHRMMGAAATVAGAARSHQIEYGVLDVDGAGRLLGYREKPRTDFLVSMGLYALRRDIVRDFIPTGESLDMPDLLLALLSAGHDVRTWSDNCVWLDIGRPDEYARAQSLVDSEPVE